MEYTFEQLPKTVAQLFEKVNNIERLLLEKGNNTLQQVDRWFDLNQLCDYLPDKPARATIYGYVHALKIPFHKKSKKLFFLQSEIDAWLKDGRKQTRDEIITGANNNLLKKKRG